jgi:hypothetical protein
VDFKRILVTDRLAWEIFGAAAREKLLYVRNPDDELLGSRQSRVGERALSLLVLFDRVSIHEYGEGTLRLPDLEGEGIVEIIAANKPSKIQPALSTNWVKGRLGARERPPRNLLRSLALVQQFRPLVVNRLLKSKNRFDTTLAGALDVSRRQYINLFLDYALAYIQGNEVVMREHILTKALPNDLIQEITEELFDFSARGDHVSLTNATLIGAILFAEEIAVIQDLSSKFGLGVATEHYGEKFRSEPALRGKELDAVAAANQFLILKAAFAEEGCFMPRVQGVKHALLLRKNPHLKAVREQLKVFHMGIMNGDRDAILEARREIQKARRKLERVANWDRPMAWLAYMSVPAVIADVLLGAPIASASLSVIGAASTAVSRRVAKRNEWVLFGT